MICPRCGHRYDGAGDACSVTCEHLAAADRDIRHYKGRNMVEGLQEANARHHVSGVLLDNGVFAHSSKGTP